MKDQGAMKDWVLFGSVAFIYHDQVIITRDVDVVVECAVEDYTGVVLPTLRRYGPETAPGVFDLGIKKLQVVPTADKRIFPEMIERAVKDTVEGVPVKVAIPEHLVIEALDRWDYSKADPVRVVRLYPKVNRKYICHLIKKYERPDGRLIKNIKSLKTAINGPLFG